MSLFPHPIHEDSNGLSWPMMLMTKGLVLYFYCNTGDCCVSNCRLRCSSVRRRSAIIIGFQYWLTVALVPVTVDIDWLLRYVLVTVSLGCWLSGEDRGENAESARDVDRTRGEFESRDWCVNVFNVSPAEDRGDLNGLYGVLFNSCLAVALFVLLETKKSMNSFARFLRLIPFG